MESKKLSELRFEVNFRYDLFIEVYFTAPVLSPHLRKFLEGNGFALKINDQAVTEGLWVTGPHVEGDYLRLRQTFKEYGITLPALDDVIKVPLLFLL